jgi:hypothetical protein
MKVQLRSFLDFSTGRFVEDALRAIPTSFQRVKDLKAALLQQEMRQNRRTNKMSKARANREFLTI